MRDSCSYSTDISHKVITQCSTLKFFLSNNSCFLSKSLSACSSSRSKYVSSKSRVNSQEVDMFRCVNRSQSEYSSWLRHTDGELIWSFRNISWMLQTLNLDNISFQRPKIKYLFFLHLDNKDLGKFFLVHYFGDSASFESQRNCKRKRKIAVNSL